MKTIKELAAIRKAERARKAEKMLKHVNANDRGQTVTCGKMTYSVAALVAAIDRAERNRKAAVSRMLASGRNREDIEWLMGQHYDGTIKRIKGKLAALKKSR